MRVQSPVDSIYLSTPEYAETSSTLQSGIGSGDSPFTCVTLLLDSGRPLSGAKGMSA